MAEDAPLLAYPQAFWTRGYLWPRSDKHRIFLADALLEVGAAMFGPEAWTGDEPNEAMDYDAGEVALALAGGAEIARMFRLRRVVRGEARMPSLVSAEPSEAGAEAECQFDNHVADYRAHLQREQRIAAAKNVQDRYDRVRAVSEWIGDVVRNGDVLTYGRNADGGELFELPSAVWRVEPLWEKLVRTCSYKRNADPGESGRSDTFLFLDRDSFSRCVATLPFAPAAVIDAGEAAKAKAPAKRGRGRRPGVGGFAAADDALVDEIVAVVRERQIAPWAAAKVFIDRIDGFTNDDEAKIKRVIARYYRRFDERGEPISLT
jgi:hypothetical protein